MQKNNNQTWYLSGRRIWGASRGMDTVVSWESHVPIISAPTGQEFPSFKRPFSIDDLIALLRSHEDTIFSCARERAIDPLTLRSQLLLHLPRFVTADDFPRERDIQREIRTVSDFLEERQRPYAQWLKQPERPIALGDLEFISIDTDTAKIYHESLHYV